MKNIKKYIAKRIDVSSKSCVDDLPLRFRYNKNVNKAADIIKREFKNIDEHSDIMADKLNLHYDMAEKNLDDEERINDLMERLERIYPNYSFDCREDTIEKYMDIKSQIFQHYAQITLLTCDLADLRRLMTLKGWEAEDDTELESYDRI